MFKVNSSLVENILPITFMTVYGRINGVQRKWLSLANKHEKLPGHIPSSRLCGENVIAV